MANKNNTALLLATLAAAFTAQAQTTPPPAEPAGQVIVPQVERRDVKLPKFASRDFSLGLFTGVYATQNFGTSSVSGVRLGYHVTEDVFVEATEIGWEEAVQHAGRRAASCG